MKNKKGFTLIELLALVVILAMLVFMMVSIGAITNKGEVEVIINKPSIEETVQPEPEDNKL
jgi:type II secretory pathway pseudopilin PulG